MPGLIHDIMSIVDKVMLEHGDQATRDQVELDKFLEGRPRPREQYKARTHEQLVEDCNKISDRLAASIRERNQLRGDVLQAQRRLDRLGLKFWIVSSVLLGEGAVILFLAKELFSRLH